MHPARLICDIKFKCRTVFLMIKKNIVLMLLLGFLQAMVFYAPIATLYRQAQGITLSQITIIESICLALCLLLE